MRVVLTAVALLAAAGCAGTRSVTRGIEEPPRMVEAVLRLIPVGTSVDDAQRFMEREGFACSRSTNDEFLGRKGLDYIHCDRSEGSGFVQRRWQVAVVYRDGKVPSSSPALGCRAVGSAPDAVADGRA